MADENIALKALVKQAKDDFSIFKDRCMGVLLYGSYAKGKQTPRSDIDICIVKPLEVSMEEIYAKFGGKYDAKIFENLPLHVKIDIIKNHIVIYGNKIELSAYFYFFRKLWGDMKHRIDENSYNNFEERMQLRRRWLNEKEKIYREIGTI